MRTVKFFCFLAIISVSIACSRTPSDETVAQDIEKKVSAEPQAQPAQVTVEAKGSKVTLKGTAKSEAARQAVERIAHEEQGVTAADPPPATTTSETCDCFRRNSSDDTHWRSARIQEQPGRHRIYGIDRDAN
jgi:hypothetical protein